jgi:hypothetical protein
MLRRSILAATIVFIALPCGARGENYFSWDADAWATSRGACDKRRGTSSLRYDVVGSRQGTLGCEGLDNTALSPSTAWDSGKTIYHRFWMRFSATFDWGNSFSKMKASRSYGTSGGTGYTLYLHKGQVALSECAECVPQGSGDNRLAVSYAFDPAQNPAIRDWQEYIVAVTLQTGNSRDAALALYVNGVLIGSQTGVRLRNCASGCDDVLDSAWGMFAQTFYPQLCLEGDACADGGTIWVDDLSMDDSWNSIVAPAEPLPSPGRGQ